MMVTMMMWIMNMVVMKGNKVQVLLVMIGVSLKAIYICN